jgi:hypothetical protein
MSFEDVIARTQCPFADLAVWRARRLDVPPFDEEALTKLREYGSAFRQEVSVLGDQELDMVALEIDQPSIVSSLGPFTVAVRAFIGGLHAEGCYENGELGSEENDWHIVVDGVRLFAFTFAPFYETWHPRHSPTRSGYIVVQFINSFRKIGMHRMTLAAKRRLSDRVRASFEAAGVPYFAYITQDSPEALKMVKPLHDGDPPIRWWSKA